VGVALLDPLLWLCPGPAGELKRSSDPSPTHALIPNPGSAPDYPFGILLFLSNILFEELPGYLMFIRFNHKGN
jgi:hypothetical protein